LGVKVEKRVLDSMKSHVWPCSDTFFQGRM
jgi:hypothetical protein